MKIKSRISWEDINIGDVVAPLPKVATTQMLVKWAGASGDCNPLHYEDRFAKQMGLPYPIVHGQLKRAWLMQMLVDWAGDPYCLKKFSCQFRSMDHPLPMKTLESPQEGETWWCRGKVTGKSEQDGGHLVDCDIWVENGKGEKTTVGRATLMLASKVTG